MSSFVSSIVCRGDPAARIKKSLGLGQSRETRGRVRPSRQFGTTRICACTRSVSSGLRHLSSRETIRTSMWNPPTIRRSRASAPPVNHRGPRQTATRHERHPHSTGNDSSSLGVRPVAALIQSRRSSIFGSCPATSAWTPTSPRDTASRRAIAPWGPWTTSPCRPSSARNPIRALLLIPPRTSPANERASCLVRQRSRAPPNRSRPGTPAARAAPARVPARAGKCQERPAEVGDELVDVPCLQHAVLQGVDRADRTPRSTP